MSIPLRVQKVLLHQQHHTHASLVNTRQRLMLSMLNNLLSLTVEPLMSHGLFNDVLAAFLSHEHVSCFAVYAGSEISRISSKLS